MANTTDPFANAVHGTNPQYLVEKITRLKIYNAVYWKEECFGLTAATLIDKATELKYYGGTYGGNLKPTKFLCLLLKMLQLQPEKEIVYEFIRNEDFPYLRVLGAFYLRLTGKAEEIYRNLEPLYNDFRIIRLRRVDGFTTIHMDELIDELLREESVCEITLPHMIKRMKLEDQKVLSPRHSTLEAELMSMEEEEEENENEGEENGESYGEEEEQGDEQKDEHENETRSKNHGDSVFMEGDEVSKKQELDGKDDEKKNSSSGSGSNSNNMTSELQRAAINFDDGDDEAEKVVEKRTENEKEKDVSREPHERSENHREDKREKDHRRRSESPDRRRRRDSRDNRDRDSHRRRCRSRDRDDHHRRRRSRSRSGDRDRDRDRDRERRSRRGDSRDSRDRKRRRHHRSNSSSSSDSDSEDDRRSRRRRRRREESQSESEEGDDRKTREKKPRDEKERVNDREKKEEKKEVSKEVSREPVKKAQEELEVTDVSGTNAGQGLNNKQKKNEKIFDKMFGKKKESTNTHNSNNNSRSGNSGGGNNNNSRNSNSNSSSGGKVVGKEVVGANGQTYLITAAEGTVEYWNQIRESLGMKKLK